MSDQINNDLFEACKEVERELRSSNEISAETYRKVRFAVYAVEEARNQVPQAEAAAQIDFEKVKLRGSILAVLDLLKPQCRTPYPSLIAVRQAVRELSRYDLRAKAEAT